jgi:Kef-type K+ transport system membrane component KefB
MLINVLLALTVIMITARAMGVLFKKFNQPAVIGEVIGGIMLGPSLLGRIAPGLQAAILPPDIAPVIGVIAQLGVILYMFLVGLELDLGALRGSVSKTIVIALSAIVVPFVLGALLAVPLFDAVGDPRVDRTSFVVFIGVALSITAFPVLARILEDRGLQRTPLGVLALTCAAINDAIAWCLLALAVSVMQATPSAAVRTAALTAVYIGVMLTIGRVVAAAAVARLDRSAQVGEHGVAVALVAVLLSAVATEFIGIHAIFGAFLMGTIIPHDTRVSARVTERLADIVRAMLLPAFFAFTGMRTEIGLIQTAEDWLICAAIVAVATAGKFGGTAAAARLSGEPARGAAALGALMNTRGLVELIVLNIGLDLGVITPRLFAMLVIMALVTTLMTSPLVDALVVRTPPGRRILR